MRPFFYAQRTNKIDLKGEHMSKVATEQVSTGSDESGNDSGYMGDAFNDYLEVESTETETPEEDQNTQGNTPEETTEEQPKTEGEKEEPKDIFTLAFEGANGDLDYEKIMSTSFTDNKQFQELPVEEVKEDLDAITPEQEIEQEETVQGKFQNSSNCTLQRA